MRARWVLLAIAATALAATAAPSLRSETTRRVDKPAGARGEHGSPVIRLGGVRESCRTRSEADFPGASTDPRNLVVGPLALVGGAFTDAGTVRDFGGNKFPLLVTAGHAVTVRIGRAARRTAALAYGPLPQGEVTLNDAHRTVTFVACRPGKPANRYSEDGPSGSRAGGVSATFWSGLVLTRAPSCVPLDVYVDGAASPERVGLSLGRRCTGTPDQPSQ